MSIEKDLDLPLIAALALREKQIQQNYRPIIAVHKWFARRPGTLFRGLLLAEFAGKPLSSSFYASNDLTGITVADPFMGGGTPITEANRVGCNVIGLDINPMAYWIVSQELADLDLRAYREHAENLRAWLEARVGLLYRTRCIECGAEDAKVKYFVWVKVQPCAECGREIDLFPGYLLAKDRRHPKNVLVCPSCGELAEAPDRTQPGGCSRCGTELCVPGPANRNRCRCPSCGAQNKYPRAELGAPRHRMFAIEYVCERCRPTHRGRFFRKPDVDDLAKVEEADRRWLGTRAQFVPNEEIPSGDETDRLHRWGYRHYREMFNSRQLLGLELSCRTISRVEDKGIREALATNVSDLLRYQNMLCRYDTMALKSLDIFSVHGFPVGLIQCESNMLGMRKRDGGIIGSGGWANIIDKFAKAKAYCASPFEIRHVRGRKVQIAIPEERIGRDGGTRGRTVDIRCGDAAKAELALDSLDAVFTDPPYFGNVQYAELMDFCYVWLRRLVGDSDPAFSAPTTRHQDELTGNETLARGLEHFTAGLSEVFQRMAEALKPGAPFVFTYHHNKLDAYRPVAVAILDAGLVCSASIPCPAEMGASIHISGTRSSIVDTVFVCRSTGTAKRRSLLHTVEGIAGLVEADLTSLREAKLKESRGDVRCIIYGHLTRLAVWRLRKKWNRDSSLPDRLAAVSSELGQLPCYEEIERYLNSRATRQLQDR